MIVDLLAPTRKALYDRLSAALASALGPVFDTVLPGTKPPFTVIGAIDVDPSGGKGEQLDRMTVEIHSIHEGTSRAPLLAMMHGVRLALEGQSLVAPGAAFERPDFDHATASDQSDEGMIFAGISIFSFDVWPA